MKHTHLHTRLLALLLCCALVLPLSACGEEKSTTQQDLCPWTLSWI